MPRADCCLPTAACLGSHRSRTRKCVRQLRPPSLKILLLFGENSLSNLQRAKITALGTYVPPRILSNQDLEKLVDTTDQWITERTGIRERHIVEKGVASSDLAVQAACRALAQRGIGAGDVEAIIVAN